MKKLLFVIILLLSVSSLFAKVYSLSNNHVELHINVTKNNNAYISFIKDLKTNQEFIREVSDYNSLWNFSVIKSKEFKDPKIVKLFPYNAEKVEVFKNKNKLVLKFINVSNEKISDKFNVICTITQENNNNYFHIKISSGKEYGIWKVTYPFIADLDTKDGDEFFIPYRGDVLVNEFSNINGFPTPYSDYNDKYTRYFWFNYPLNLQYTSFTKGKSTLYMCPEDTTGSYKTHEWSTNHPNSMNVHTTYSPENMGVAGYEYNQKNMYNIAVVVGDYYDAAKKYRKWGIKSNYAPFSHGKIENREDLPDWWKELCVISRTWNRGEVDRVIKAKKNINVPFLVHLYEWGSYPHDTYYPDWGNINENTKGFIQDLKDVGCYVMPYTNCHLVDCALSETTKKYEDDILKLDYNGKRSYEPWAKQKGADNNIACTGSEYYNLYLNEIKRIYEEYPFDALYVDQVGASNIDPCFNEKHNHPLGGGTFVQSSYTNLMNDVRVNINKITNKKVPMITEDGGDEIFFDGWLKVNETKLKGHANPIRAYIYSGYVYNLGDTIYPAELKDDYTCINKMASQLVNGFVLFWQLFDMNGFWENENFVKYAKNICEARYSAIDYFNLGEMVRNITITTPVSKVPVNWYHYTTKATGVQGEVNSIKSCVYYYKGKAMVCITNANYEDCVVNWYVEPKDINLKEKNNYKITQIFPDKKFISQGRNIGDTVNIPKLSTIIYIIE